MQSGLDILIPFQTLSLKYKKNFGNFSPIEFEMLISNSMEKSSCKDLNNKYAGLLLCSWKIQNRPSL